MLFRSKQLSTLSEIERDFWRGYFSDVVERHLTRERLLRQNDCLIDFHENHSFTRADLVNGSGAVFIPESEERQRDSTPSDRISRTRPRKARSRRFTTVAE